MLPIIMDIVIAFSRAAMLVVWYVLHYCKGAKDSFQFLRTNAARVGRSSHFRATFEHREKEKSSSDTGSSKLALDRIWNEARGNTLDILAHAHFL